MILFIDVIVMPSSFIVVCFVNDCSIFANHDLCLYGMCFLLSRIVRFASSIIYWSWNLLFCGIYKSKKARKVLFNFFRSSEPFCQFVYFLWNWQTFSYQTFNLLYISVYVTLIQIKYKASQSVSDIKTMIVN